VVALYLLTAYLPGFKLDSPMISGALLINGFMVPSYSLKSVGGSRSYLSFLIGFDQPLLGWLCSKNRRKKYPDASEIIKSSLNQTQPLIPMILMIPVILLWINGNTKTFSNKFWGDVGGGF